MTTISVGDLTIQPILDGVARLRPDVFIGSDWTSHQHLLDPTDGLLHVPVGAFVLETAGVTVMFDAGVGDVHNQMFDGGELLGNLRSAGYRPDDIDVILVSHLHLDHIGWLVVDGQAVFPNATVRIAAADWEHFVVGGNPRTEHLRAIESRLELIDSDGVSIAPGITTRHTPGHTPGHTSSIISSGNQRVIVMGDAIHCPAQLTEPEWQVVFDTDPALGQRTRDALLREAEQPGTELLPMHFPGMQAARLLAGSIPRTWHLGA